MAQPNQVQQAIIDQMGGNKFRAMTGCKQMVLMDDTSVKFIIGGGAAKRIKHVIVKLNGADLYDVTYGKILKHEWKVVAESKGLYNNMLQSDFTAKTGMYTTL